MNKKPYIVAVAGGTCSGKSTITKKLGDDLEKNFKVKIINMDTYFKKEPPTTIAPITRKIYVEHNHPDTLDMPTMLNDCKEAFASTNYDVVIIEGLFALYIDDIRDSADLKIFVDLASDARLVRRITKHMGWGQSYEQVTDRYIDTVRFRHNELIEPTRWHADVVINGTLDQNKGTAIVLNYIESQLK